MAFESMELAAGEMKNTRISFAEDEGYYRVVEQFPVLLQLNAAKVEDLKLIISMAYHIGLGDGRDEALSVLGGLLTGVVRGRARRP